MARVITLPPRDVPARNGVRPAGWWHDADDAQRLQCDLCPRGCRLLPGQRGFCFVRENLDGQMVSTTYGRSTGFCVDPIEKKPLFHFFPGTSALSFGTAGCNLGCKFCQNWSISKSRDVEAACEAAAPEQIAEAAVRTGCRSVAFTYNDPIVWAEYAIDTAAACRRLGVKTVAVTSGYITAEAREAFYENIDAANVDLKGFSDDFYRRQTSGRLEPVLDTLRWLAHRRGTWLEITNLLIPGENDAPAEIERMCRWIADELGLDVPLHFSAFHPAFELSDHPPTPPATLAMAYDVARRCSLRYVYTGNINDRRRQSTYCPGCGEAVVERDGYALGGYHIRQGHCRRCGAAIAGCFDDAPGDWGGRRLPIRIGDVAPRRVEAPPPPTARPTLSAEQQRQVFRAAGRRVAAAVLGVAGPPLAAILGDAASTPVYGSFVSLKRGGQLRSCCGFLGHASPLGEALGHAALRAAKDDPRFPPITAAELPHLDMEVWLLWGPEPVAARGRDRLQAITIGRHGVQVARGPARGLLLPAVAVEHHLDALGFLQQVCLKAGLPSDAWMQDAVSLMTFEGDAIRGRLQEALAVEGTEIAKPQAAAAARGEKKPPTSAYSNAEAAADRPVAVAGAFYPERREQIERTLDELFANRGDDAPRPWAAAMVPHAGWIYSGRLAAAVLARIAIPSRVVILCPHHRPEGAAWAVAPCGRWLIPGGAVEADPELGRRLAGGVAGLELDARAHGEEHAIEVQLPLLARLAPEVRVVGIAVGRADLPELQRFGRELAAAIAKDSPRPLLLISSDMNHFADEAETRRLDRLALDAMQTLDPVHLYQTVQKNRISMCGLGPAVIVMEALRHLDLLERCVEVGYATSAQRSGDAERVVGYAGVLLGQR